MGLGGFPGGSNSKESTCNAGNLGLGRSSGEGNGYPLQNSCLENPMDGVAWQATVHVVTKRQTRQNDKHFHMSPNLDYTHKKHAAVFSLI